MAIHTALRADGVQTRTATGVHQIKHWAKFGINRRNLHPAPGHKSDITLLIKIQRTRIRRIDDPALQACRGVNQKLRAHRNLERLKNPEQALLFVRGAERRFLRLGSSQQAGKCVARNARVVVMRRLLKAAHFQPFTSDRSSSSSSDSIAAHAEAQPHKPPAHDAAQWQRTTCRARGSGSLAPVCHGLAS